MLRHSVFPPKKDIFVLFLICSIHSLIFWWIFKLTFTQYILTKYLFSSNSFQVLPTSLLTQLMFFFFLSLSRRKKIKGNKRITSQRTKRSKQTKMSALPLKNDMELVLCWATTPGYGAWPGVWLIQFNWRQLIVSLPVGSDYKCPLGWGWDFMNTLPSQCSDTYGLNLCSYCASQHEFICASVPLGLHDTSLRSSIISVSYYLYVSSTT